MKIEDLQKRIDEEKEKEICSLCHGTGMVDEGRAGVHTCWKCLYEGKLS